MHERFGSGLVTDVLKGTKSAKIKTLGFDNLSTYGIMSDYSKDTIKDLIYYLITEGYINSVGDKYPILVLDKSAEDVLFHDKKVFIKRKIEKILPKSTLQDEKSELDYDKVLFGILKELRMEIAQLNNIPPFIVFTDVSLKEMSTYFPINVENMLKITGVGVSKLEKYGKIFIDTISKYVEENNIKIPEKLDNITSKVSLSSASDKSQTEVKNETKKPKEDTKIITCNLYKAGKSIDEICNIRGLTRVTVENHLLKCYEAGIDVDLEKDVQTQYKDIILNAIKLIGIEKLRPLKDALPEQVTYFDIHYYIIKYNNNDI